jgi:hypothetical protein
MKYVAKKAKRDYALYKTYEGLSKVGSNIDSAIKVYITRGLQLLAFFKQRLYETHSFSKQVISLFSICNGYLDSVDVQNVQFFLNMFFAGHFADVYLENRKFIYFFMKLDLLESLLITNSFEFLEKDLHNIFKSYQNFFLANVQPRLNSK